MQTYFLRGLRGLTVSFTVVLGRRFSVRDKVLLARLDSRA